MLAKRDSRSFPRAGVAMVCLACLGGGSVSADIIHVYEGESIQAAINAAAETGDEIIVHPGTYYEGIDLLGKAIWLHSANGPEVTIIDAAGLNLSVVTCTSGELPSTVLQGFTLTGGTGTRSGGSTNGGGLYVLSSRPKVIGCIFTVNSADYGAAIHCNAASSPIVVDCAFIANTSSSVGGGIYIANACDPVVINCAFRDNSAAVASGGMHNYANSDPFVVNCLFAGNSAQVGGAMTNTNTSNATVVNCTFSDNTAAEGAAMRNYQSAPTVVNCIFWGDDGEEIYNLSSTPTVTYCDVQGGYGGEGNIDADPLFVDPAEGDHHIAAGSPCIDAGNSGAVPPDITTDLDGNPRFVDDPDTDDTGIGYPCVDMGAYEFQVDSCPADFDGDGDVDTADLLYLLGAWGTPDGDVDGDGDTDTADLLALLGAWGECP